MASHKAAAHCVNTKAPIMAAPMGRAAGEAVPAANRCRSVGRLHGLQHITRGHWTGWGQGWLHPRSQRATTHHGSPSRPPSPTHPTSSEPQAMTAHELQVTGTERAVRLYSNHGPS